MTSHYVHCTVISSMPNFSAPPFRIVNRDKEGDRGFLALHFSLVYAVMTCIILGRQNVELSKDVQETIQNPLMELRAVASPTGEWVVGVPFRSTKTSCEQMAPIHSHYSFRSVFPKSPPV